jgi:hypothetical protein
VKFCGENEVGENKKKTAESTEENRGPRLT